MSQDSPDPTADVLVTDELFVSPKNWEDLRHAGLRPERLRKVDATEDELITWLQGKRGYILGGIERVTPRVLEACPKLEAIAFTGAGYREFITGHIEATRQGIAISNAPGGNAGAVAEFTLTLALGMAREVFDLGRTGTKTFAKTPSLRDLKIGVIGMGHVGTLFVKNCHALGARSLAYYSRTRKPSLEKELGMVYLEMEQLLPWADLLSIHTSKDAGTVLGERQLTRLREGAIILNVAYPDAVDVSSLATLIRKSPPEKPRLRVAFDGLPTDQVRLERSVQVGAPDHPKVDRFTLKDLPPGHFFWSNSQTAYCTTSAIEIVGDMATKSLINLLTKEKDSHLVNPEFLANRKKRKFTPGGAANLPG
jgi:phosphoglycerate dehydrogenase-like enzyme